MLDRGPKEERVPLSEYERRQFRVIEQSLELEEFDWSRSSSTGAEALPLWLALLLGCGLFALLGLLAGFGALFWLGVLGMIISWAAHATKTRKPDGYGGDSRWDAA